MKNNFTKRYRIYLKKKIEVCKTNLKCITPELDSKKKQSLCISNCKINFLIIVTKELSTLETIFQDDDLKNKDIEAVVNNYNTPRNFEKECSAVETMSQDNELDDGFIFKSKPKKKTYSYLKIKTSKQMSSIIIELMMVKKVMLT